MNNIFLDVKDICVAKGSKEIIRNVSFTTKPGELISVLGPSGSGKTTLINTLIGFNNLDSGEIICDGQVLANSNNSINVDERGFSAVFQSLNLFPHLSVRENILYGISKLSKNEKKERLNELTTLAKLSDMLDRDVTTLSGGEKQRVAIARGLAPKPKILFLDEPFSSLDRNLQIEVRSFIKKVLKESGVSAFLVTHDKDDAFYFSDRVMIMNEGELIQFDTPENIYNKPINDFVASFFGLGLKLEKENGEAYYPCASLIQICHTDHENAQCLAKITDQYFNMGKTYCTLELEGSQFIVVPTRMDLKIGDRVGLLIRD